MARRKKIPNEEFEATIESLSHEGRGISHINDKVVFIDGALPGETVRFKYARIRAKRADAYITQVIKPSSRRVEPRCQHYGLCGGCSMQHMGSADQIDHKQSVLLEQLQHIGGVQPEQLLAPLSGPVWGYRRKARLGVKYVIKKEKLLVGFREKRSNFIADLDQCEVLHPAIGMQFQALKNLVESLSISREIPQLEIAVTDETTAIILRHMNNLNPDDMGKLDQFQQQTGISIYLQAAGPDSVVPLNDRTCVELTYPLNKHDIVIRFRPDDFTQVNFEINEAMVDRVIDMLDIQAGDDVLDLFCGLGNFSLVIARYAGSVTAVEGSQDLVERAKQNAVANRLSNIEFHAMNLMQFDLDKPYLQKQFQKILLDPPRNGAQEIIRHLKMEITSRLVYVSCNPSTLARDAGILVNEHGFKLTRAGVMDMFPHTTHVESIACFER